MNLAIHAASTFTSPLILGIAAKDVYENVAKQPEFSHKDFSVVYQVLKAASDAQFAKNVQEDAVHTNSQPQVWWRESERVK